MPYYQEWRGTDSHGVRVFKVGSTGAITSTSYPVVKESSKALTYRSNPSAREIISNEIPDFQADPYAYFLRNIAERDYAARLSERHLPSKGSPDRGHAFDLSKHTYYGPLVTASNTDTYYGNVESLVNARAYMSPVGTNRLDHIHDGTLVTPATYKGSGLDVFAQQAYAKVAPTSVQFDAAAFLGELHEGLPKLSFAMLKDMSKFYKGLGSDYLNVQFGWKPFIKDLQNAAKSLNSATQMLANNGKRVHRKLGLPPVLKGDEYTGNGTYNIHLGEGGFLNDRTVLNKLGYPNGGPGIRDQQAGACQLDYLKSSSVYRWFEGEFSLFYPLDFNPDDFTSRLNQLINLKMTPAVLWELTPWSWLVDWFLRIQDTIVANQKAANDLLVMHYGYAMETTSYKTVASYRDAQLGDSFTKWTGLPLKGQLSSETVYKKRLRANPFGFKAGGEAALTEGQLAILGALGASKTR